jgi:hypothetical protein
MRTDKVYFLIQVLVVGTGEQCSSEFVALTARRTSAGRASEAAAHLAMPARIVVAICETSAKDRVQLYICVYEVCVEGCIFGAWDNSIVNIESKLML